MVWLWIEIFRGQPYIKSVVVLDQIGFKVYSAHQELFIYTRIRLFYTFI
jgi:hypothetical protein